MKRIPRVIFIALFFATTVLHAQEEFNFDELDQLEKKNLSLSGHTELKYEHVNFNCDSRLYQLDFPQGNRASLDRLTAAIQIGGSYSRSIANLNWLLEASGAQDQVGWTDSVDILEAYASFRPSSNLTFEAGKKALKWGKGYAWNPVGFVERPKNPSDPNLAREGFIMATADFIRSFNGSLKTVAFTPVLLLVSADINEDFGDADHLNVAAKLYFLYLDTDIDFMVFGGGSKSTRFGVDFSRNISSNFEIHGELGWFPVLKKQSVSETGELSIEESDSLSNLLGIRYLTENEITWIAEIYHNGTGFSEKQNYLYLKASTKDSFDILYLTPSLTTIVNLDDSSFMLTPELLYKGFANIELRLRAPLLFGSDLSEYGEKKTEWKCELRMRYSF